jgi:hypothetical protein
VLVDDTMYVDLVRAGFEPRFGVVWFYKLDFTTNLDPSIAANLPQGWRAFDYVVSTRVIRSALARNRGRLRQVRLALANSRPVATFGSGPDRVEVRRITGVGTGSGLIPRGERADEARVEKPPPVPAGLWPSIGDPLPSADDTAGGREVHSDRPAAPRRPAARKRSGRDGKPGPPAGRAREVSRRARPGRRPAARRARRSAPGPARARHRTSEPARARRSVPPPARARQPDSARSGHPSTDSPSPAHVPVRGPSAGGKPEVSPPRELLDGVRGAGGHVDLDPHGDLMTLGGRR